MNCVVLDLEYYILLLSLQEVLYQMRRERPLSSLSDSPVPVEISYTALTMDTAAALQCGSEN